MVSLDNKDSFSGLNYYAEMQLGTRNKTSKTQFHSANQPMNVTYESGKVSGALDAAATQLMSLSTQKYATQVILDVCISAKKCNFECPYVSAYSTAASSTSKRMSQAVKTYEFA